MQLFKNNDYVYVDEDISLSLEDFDIELSDIYHSEISNRFDVSVTLVAKDEDLAKLLNELGIGSNYLSRTFSKKYDFRGRRTEEQRQEAIEDAKKELISNVNDGKYRNIVLKKLKEHFQKHLEYNKKNFMRTTEREFTENDHLNWDNVEDEELEEIQDEMDDIYEQIQKLKAEKEKLRKKKIARKNVIFWQFIKENGVNSLYEENRFPEKVEDILVEKAENGELFQTNSFSLNF